MHPFRSISTLALLLGAVPSAWACSKSEAAVVAGLRVSQPLIATPGGDDATVIQVVRDGCVRVRYPLWDTRAGSYAFTLSPKELAALRSELAASGLSRFAPDAVRQDLARRAARKSATENTWHSSDGEVLEFVVERSESDAAKGEAVSLVWSGLREQRLNHPDQPDLAALQAVRDRLLKLGEDRRLTKSGN